MQNNQKKNESIDEMMKENEKYKKHVKLVMTVNIVLSVAIIAILLLRNCCGC